MWQRSKTAEAATLAAQQATTAPGEMKIFRVKIASTGRVVSNLDVDIKCKASGEIIKLPFDVSDEVKQGDLLLELDPIDEQRQVKLADASLAQSNAKLAQAKQNLEIAKANLKTSRMKAEANQASMEAKEREAKSRYEREDELLKGKLTSPEEYDTKKTAWVQAKADALTALAAVEALKAEELGIEVSRQAVLLAQSQVDSDQVALDDKKQRLDDTKVMAPMAGRVAARTAQIGTIISSAVTNVGGGSTVMTLSDLSHIFTLASVDESDIGRVALGQDVIITADAFKGEQFQGKVVRIATKGVNTANVVKFEVKIEVTSPNRSLLKPEMTTNNAVVIAESKNALTVPVAAVFWKEKKAMVSVRKVEGTTEDREVELGETDGTVYEIKSGLKANEMVLVQKGGQGSKWQRGGRPMMM